MTRVQKNTSCKAKRFVVDERENRALSNLKHYWEKFDACAVFVGPWADCKFYSAWLAAVGDVQELWVEACKDKRFSNKIQELSDFHRPNFEIGASVLMMRLERKLTSVLVDLGNNGAMEFCMMCAVGLFKRNNKLYEMAIPESISLRRVKQAALTLARTERGFYLHPEWLVVSMPYQRAVALQKRLLKRFWNSST